MNLRARTCWLLTLTLAGCGPAPAPKPADAAAAAPERAAPAPSGPAMNEAAPSLAAVGVLPLGNPTVARAAELRAVQWAQHGGGTETLRAADGASLVVLTFPDATKVTYTSTEWSITPDGAGAVAPLAVTSPTANPIQPRSADPGPAKFQREVYMFLDWEPGPNTPFAVAFELPSAGGTGTLRIGAAQAPIRW